MDQSIVYLHGVPHSGDMWKPFLERTGGDAPDLPGFGKSEKPASGDYTFRGLGRWVSDYTRDLERFSLVMHDWGSLGLLAAMERPEAVERIVLIDAVPFLPGYRWHTVARAWRRPFIGEMFMGLSSKWGFRRLGRMQGADKELLEAFIEEVWPHFDHGTQRAILRLYRSAPEDELARAGESLDKLKGSPALVVWGGRDPYLPTEFAHAYAERLGGETAVYDDAGHWPWFEHPEIVDRVATFLEE